MGSEHVDNTGARADIGLTQDEAAKAAQISRAYLPFVTDPVPAVSPLSVVAPIT
jgi:hypothetical protein